MQMQRCQQTGSEAPTSGAQVDLMIAELELIVERLEADLSRGRATDFRCAQVLHSLHLRAEELFR